MYLDNNRFTNEWLRRLIDAGHIAPGEVLDRDIREIEPGEINARQFHAFAGIGVWSYALQLAGWPDDVGVWTGSCPCQPFSVAGKRKGAADDRHLWPAWFDLIRECLPPVILGEQVASADGRAWFESVSADLEGLGYAVAAADLCAAGVGAPHLRQRLYFVAYANDSKRRAEISGWNNADRKDFGRTQGAGDVEGCCGACELAHSHRDGLQASIKGGPEKGTANRGGSTRGFWADAEWIPCRDRKARAVEPGTFPLADGASARVGRLCAYGNAIVPQVAAVFIRAVMDSMSV